MGCLRYMNISSAQAGFPSTSPKICMWPTEPLTSMHQSKKHKPSPCVWQWEHASKVPKILLFKGTHTSLSTGNKSGETKLKTKTKNSRRKDQEHQQISFISVKYGARILKEDSLKTSILSWQNQSSFLPIKFIC